MERNTLALGESKEKDWEKLLPSIARKEFSKEVLLALKSTLLLAGREPGRGWLFWLLRNKWRNTFYCQCPSILGGEHTFLLICNEVELILKVLPHSLLCIWKEQKNHEPWMSINLGWQKEKEWKWSTIKKWCPFV